MGIDESLLTNLSKQTENTKDKSEKYQEAYDQYILRDKIFNNALCVYKNTHIF